MVVVFIGRQPMSELEKIIREGRKKPRKRRDNLSVLSDSFVGEYDPSVIQIAGTTVVVRNKVTQELANSKSVDGPEEAGD
jgi:hypothetical protein